MTTARQLINSIKPNLTKAPPGPTEKGSAGYDNIRDDIEKTKSLRELSLPFTKGSILFMGNNAQITHDNSNLFWDDINKRFGIGTTTPNSTLEVNGSIESKGWIFGQHTSHVYSTNVFKLDNGAHAISLRITANALNIYDETGDGWASLNAGGLNAYSGGISILNDAATLNFGSGYDVKLARHAAGVLKVVDSSADLATFLASKIGIGTTTPATSAQLDITSTTGALLLPRMTTAQKNALTAVNGMLLYDSTLNQTQTYENGAWRQI
jgi:hypothetical protein